MPRSRRRAPGGVIFHVLNRGVGRRTLFHKPGDFAAFERCLEGVMAVCPIRLLAYCLMPNHWHLLLWPAADGQLAAFMQRLTTTHVRRWQMHQNEVGLGHLYQGRFRSFPVQEDGHFLTVARYVERNALRAALVKRAQDWKWCSLWRRESNSPRQRGILSEWPVTRPADWVRRVNEPQTDAELDELRTSLRRGRPFGNDAWRHETVRTLGLEASLRDGGRPRKRATAGL